jgi:hypothetical protein
MELMLCAERQREFFGSVANREPVSDGDTQLAREGRKDLLQPLVIADQGPQWLELVGWRIAWNGRDRKSVV